MDIKDTLEKKTKGSVGWTKKVIKKEVKEFMTIVREFLARKNGGDLPPEWELSLKLLETYYTQFVQTSRELEKLDNLFVTSRYGVTAHPALKIQHDAACRLEKAMSELGLSLKSASKLGVAKPKDEESALDAFFTNQAKGKKVEKR